MKVKKIAHKLFVALSFFIVVLLISIFFFQSYFLQSFYFEKKISMISGEMNELVKEYKKENWSDFELVYRLDEFSMDNNVSAFIEQTYGIEEYKSIVLVGQDVENITWYILVDSFLIDEYLQGQMPAVDDEYFVKGFTVYEGQNYLIAEYIGKDEIYEEKTSMYIVDGDEIYEEQLDLNIDQGNVYEEIYSDQSMFDGLLKVRAVKDIDEFKALHEYSVVTENIVELPYEDGEKTYLDSDTYYYIDFDPFYNTAYVKIVKEISTDNDEQKLVIEVNLQSIDQAISILKHYYLYFLLLAVVLVFVFAIVFSKWLTKPLVKMSKVANKMANMDFSEKVIYHSEDEIGSLANDLNVLSDSLYQKIHQLNKVNNQLKDDIERERQLEKVRKEFVANVSHELKTPLGIIKSYSEAIKDGVKKEKHDYYLKVIVDEIEAMNRLIVSMLELSKIEAKNQELNMTSINLKQIIEKILSSMELSFKENNLSWEMMGECKNVIVNQSKIEQVITNILSNAVKYAEKNSTIKVCCEIQEKKCKFEFTNVCKPLTQEELSNIWNRFYKVDQSHHREFGGTGLGLAIVKAILEAHKCEYGVVQDERGLTFYFKLDVEP